MNIIDIFGTVASITSVIGFFPQIYKIHQTKSVQDLSFWMLLNFFICGIVWVIYGILTASTYVLITNIIGSAICGILFAQKLYFQNEL